MEIQDFRDMKHSPHFVDAFPYWKQMISIAFTVIEMAFFSGAMMTPTNGPWRRFPRETSLYDSIHQIPRTARTMSKQKQSQCIFLRLEFLKPQNVVLWHGRGHVRWTENTSNNPIPHCFVLVVSPVFLHQNFWGTGHQQEIDDAERAARGYQWLGPAF